MSDERQLIDTYIDFRPNWPRNDETRKMFRQQLIERFGQNLPGAIERIWEVPILAIKSPFGPYLGLWLKHVNSLWMVTSIPALLCVALSANVSLKMCCEHLF